MEENFEERGENLESLSPLERKATDENLALDLESGRTEERNLIVRR